MSLLLFLLNLISYGQIFWMGIWKDDNAIFFKIQHINEPAGFFGKGLIGDGFYRFSFTPYWFVYKLFGVNSTFPYYLLIFIFYFLATIAVYKLFTKIVSTDAGRIAGFLFACGFIASEGYFWIANAMVSDVSIILVCLILFCYFKFRQRKVIYYLLALLFYWASAYFVPIRSYYFFGIIVLFDLLFLDLKKFIFRIVPFFLIFRYFFITNGDARAGGLNDLIQALVHGKFYVSYGILSTISNIFVADNLSAKVFDIFGKYSWYLALISLTILIYLAFRKKKRAVQWSLVYFVVSVIWYFFSKLIYKTPLLNLSLTNFFVVFLGGLIFVFCLFFYCAINEKFRKLYLFFSLSLLISIASYWAYDPLVSFNTTHRYLIGAFFFLVGFMTILYKNLGRGKYVIVLWGLINLVSGFFYQRNILVTRSLPVDSFYKQLKSSLPKIEKGDLLYFDLGNNNAKSYFNDAISTASMPDETSFAWRYGVDRYDFHIVSDFQALLQLAKKEKTQVSSIHSFYYVDDKLRDTTSETRDLLSNKEGFKSVSFTTEAKDNQLTVNFKEPISSLVPVQFKMTASSTVDVNAMNFPVGDKKVGLSDIYTDKHLRQEAFLYKSFLDNFRKNTQVSVSSFWNSDIADSIIDNNFATNWRANRITWSKEDTYFILNLGQVLDINQFVWVNGYGNSTPTNYSLYTSADSKSWDKVAYVNRETRIDSKELQVVSFEPRKARFIKMKIDKTLDSDAPQIAESWVVPSEFGNLKVGDLSEFVDNPFLYIADKQSFLLTVNGLNNKISTQIGAQAIDLIYDSLRHDYLFTIPAGGTKISQIKLMNNLGFSSFAIKNISYRHMFLDELLQK